MASAGYKGKIMYASAVGGSGSASGFTAVAGFDNASLNVTQATGATSALKDDDGWERNIPTRRSATLSASGPRIYGDTEQDALETAFEAGTQVALAVSGDGTNGRKGLFTITSWNVTADGPGVTTVSLDAQLSGPLLPISS